VADWSALSAPDQSRALKVHGNVSNAQLAEKMGWMEPAPQKKTEFSSMLQLVVMVTKQMNENTKQMNENTEKVNKTITDKFKQMDEKVDEGFTGLKGSIEGAQCHARTPNTKHNFTI
jgi:hypothetical protein